MDTYDWLNKFYSFYLPAVVSTVCRRGLSIDAHCKNQPNKSKLALCKALIHFNSRSYRSKKTVCISYKVGVAYIYQFIKEELA